MTQAPAQPAPPKDWQEKRKRRLLVTSASQQETFELCARKWWLDNVRGLKVPMKDSNIFGTVLHAVVQRYLEADDLGMDIKTGRPVDLYPPGWHIAWDKYKGCQDGEITPAEQDAVKRLVEAAITEGILQRMPGRSVEHEFRDTITELACVPCEGKGLVNGKKCETCGGDGKGTHIQIVGFIDLLFRDEIQDHKTSKSAKWFKSANALTKNTQMLIYAKVAIETARKRGEPIPSHVTLRHNQYCKDLTDLRVRKTETKVPVADIERKWSEIVNNAMWMDYYRRTVNHWHEIPDPRDKNACNAYGGCAFAWICTGREDENGYQNRLAPAGGGLYTSAVALTVNGQQSLTKGSVMSQFDAAMAAKRGGVVQTPAQPGAVNPPMPQNFQAPPMQAPPQQFQPQPQQQPQGYQQPQFQAPPQGQPQGQQFQPPPQQQAPQSFQPSFQTQPMQAPAPQQTGQPVQPPWADNGCGACQGLGFNTNGQPCMICSITARNQGRNPAEAYNITPLGNGLAQWTAQDGSMSGVSLMYRGAQNPVTTSQPQQQAQPPQQPQQFQPPPQQPPQTQAIPAQYQGPPAGAQQGQPQQAPQQQQAQPETAEEAKKRGRPAKSFILMINTPHARGYESRGDRQVIHLTQVLHQAQEEIRAASGTDSFYKLDAFKRRDALASLAPKLVEGFGTAIVVADGIGQGVTDLSSLFAAIRPYAGMEFGHPASGL